MTGFAGLIVVFCIFYRLAFSMEDNGNTTANSLNGNSFSAVSNRELDFEVDFETRLFDQKLDHFDKDNLHFWFQFYFVVQMFYNDEKENSPVFFMISGRNGIQKEDITNGIWIQWAKKFQALCFLIEHRFFGDNYPTKDTSTENLRKYLNVRQALADFRYFIRTMKDDWKLTSRNKWIVFGGEYPGTLAALMRLDRHPLVDGAVASSAHFPMDYFQPEYFERFGGYWQKIMPIKLGSQCYKSTHKAIISLSQMIDFSLANFRLCKFIKQTFLLNRDFDCKNDLQVSYLFEQITQQIVSIVKNEERLKLLCETFIPNSKNEMEELAIGLIKNNVIFANYENTVHKNRLTNGIYRPSRQLLYQKCTELGGFPVPETLNQPFIFRFNRQFLFKLYCGDTFGLDYSTTTEETDDDSIDETKRVKFIDFNYYRDKSYSNTVFIDGDLDLDFDARMSKFNPKNNIVILIKGADRCDDMKVYDSPTSPLIQNAQTQIEELINKWINEL